MAPLARALAALTAAPLLLAVLGCAADDEQVPGGAASGGAGDAASSSAASPATSAASASSTPTPAPPSATSEPGRDGATTSLFFGDSYVVGGGYTGPQNSMAAVAARRLGWSYQLRGGGGTGVVEGNPDYGIAPFLGQIQQGALDVGQVDWLVIEGGGNDRTEDPRLVTRRAVRVLKAARTRHPEARLVLVGGMDPTVDSFTDTDAVIGAYAAAAARLGIPFISAQHWLEGRPDLVGPDFDHPTPAGHRLCGRKLARALRALG